MTREELTRAYPGESGTVEFKESVGNADRIQDALVAFSNTEGGVLLVGVTRNGDVAGVRDPGEVERQLHQIARSTHNPGRYEVHTLQVDGKNVLVLSIARREGGFAQTSQGVVKVRQGASNVALVGEQLNRFVHARTFTHFEDAPSRVSLHDVSPRLLDRLRHLHGWPSDVLEERLIEHGYAARDGAAINVTICGGLFLLEDPTKLGLRAQVDVLRFPPGSDDPDKRTTVSGPVDEQIARTTAIILDELGQTSVLVGARRVDLPKLPQTALREAVANAVAHRSYELAGTTVRVEIRDDSVKIISPGPLPEPVTVQNLRNQQAARNRIVLSTLRRMGLAEDLGRGIDRIEDEMAAQLLQPPEFSDDRSLVTVTLRTSGLVSARERGWLLCLAEGQRLSSQHLLTLALVGREGQVTNSSVRAMLGLDSVAARAITRQLCALGLLVQQGARGGTSYRLARNLVIPASVYVDRAELEEQIVAMARNGRISNSDVRDALGIDRVEAGRLLRSLVAAGRLVQHGSKRGTRYLAARNAPGR